MIRALLLSLLVLSTGASAAYDKPSESSFVFGGLSYHALQRSYRDNGVELPFNERNLTVGVEIDDIRWVVFDNSYKQLSTAFMWTPSVPLSDNVSLGARLGFATGYQDTPMKLPLAPIAGLEVDLRYGGFHLVPAVQLPGVFTLHAQIDY